MPTDAQEREHLIHELQVHQAELEAQNQQLREAQRELEDSRARYADLYDFAPVGYCTFNLAGCVSDINLTGAAMLGKQRAGVIGRPFAVYLTERDRAVFRTHLHRRLASPQGAAIVELTLGSATPPVVVQMVSAVVLDRAGTVVGCRSTFTDITEQKRAEETLRHAVHMREQFLAIVSHDLRNPLNSILLGSEILRSSPTMDAKELRQSNLIADAAARMTRLLSDLLDLSSMDAGHLSMQRKLESVAGLLSATIENARPGAAAKAISLEMGLADPKLVAWCDRDRVLQVLLNLVGNALKFSRAHDVVRIEARRAGAQIEFAVRDSGCGMSRSQLDHIFDPYWQAPNTAKMGTGLGLSIARGIVEFHGGTIWAESVVDHGSCFFFTVPYTSNQPSALRARTISGPLAGSPPIAEEIVGSPRSEDGPILIVDDELDTQALLTEVLHRDGYEVVTTGDGAKALEYLRTTTTLPRLILLDLVMPNMDGWQFIEQRSHDPRLADIPVVLISGQFAAPETARSLGLASCIEKPITIASLREALARMCHRSPASA